MASGYKPNLFDYITAFFDPNVAINDDGYFVKSDSIFDSGNSSSDYLRPNAFFYGTDGHRYDLPDEIDSYQDIVNSATKIKDSNDARSKANVSEFWNTFSDKQKENFDYYVSSLMYKLDQNISSAEKIAQMNEASHLNAYNRSLDYVKDYYPTLVKSLQRAGINPIIAFRNGVPGMNYSGAASSLQAPYDTSNFTGSSIPGVVAQTDMNTIKDMVTNYLSNSTNMSRTESQLIGTILTAVLGAYVKSKTG